MGRSNRQRRADKQRRRARERSQAGREPGGRYVGEAPTVEDLVCFAALSLRREQADDHAHAMKALQVVDTSPGGRAELDRALTGALERTVGVLWDNGWQPSDLVHVVRRRLAAVGVALIGAVIAAQARAYSGDMRLVDPPWQAQLDELGVVRPPAGARYLASVGLDAGLTWWATAQRGVELLAVLGSLPALAHLAPGPREWGRRPSAMRPARRRYRRAHPRPGEGAARQGRVHRVSGGG